MAKWSLVAVGVLAVVGVLFGGLVYGMEGDLNLKVSCKGAHTSPGGYGAAGGYPFDLGGEAKASGAVLAKGGEKALQAIFGSLTDKKNGNAKVTKVSGDLKIKGGKVSGNVKIEWSVQSNPMFVQGDLDGTASGEGNITSISFKGTNVKAGGLWNWGGGNATLGGSGSFSVSSK